MRNRLFSIQVILNSRSLGISGALIILLGFGTGATIFFVTSLPTKWFFSVITSMLILFIVLLVPNKKHWLLYMLTLAIPVNASIYLGKTPEHHTGGADSVPEVYLAHFFLFALYGLWTYEAATEKRIVRLGKADFAAFAFLSWSCLSFFNSVEIIFSCTEILRISLPFLIYFYVAHNIRDDNEIRRIVLILLLGVFLQSILAVLQVYYGDASIMRILAKGNPPTMQYMGQEVPRVHGSVGWPILFGMYLSFILPVSLSMALFSDRMLIQLSCLLLYVLGAVAIILARTRIGIGGLAVGFFITLCLYFYKSKHDNIRKIAATSALLLAFAITLVCLWEIAISRFVMDDQGSAALRVSMIKLAIDIIKEKPVLGIGLNNYINVMPLFYFRKYYDVYGPVHNSYLLLAAEIGLPGLMIFMYFIFLAYKKLLRIMKTTRCYLLTLSVGLLAGMTSFLLENMLDTGFKNSIVNWNLLCFVIGIVTATDRLTKSEGSPLSRVRKS